LREQEISWNGDREPIKSDDDSGDAMNSSSSTLADALRIYGNLSLLEMAPVLLAADQIYPGKTVLKHGSVMSLWGQSSDLASLDSAGQSDVATNSETQALRASVEHPDLRFIFTVAECPYRIVARRSAGIARLADLHGKRVGTQIHSSAAYFLECMLRTVGLTADDVVCVPFMAKTEAPLTLMPEALRSGGLDAVALWEPQVQRAKLAIGDDAVEFCDPAVYTEKFNLCTRQDHLDDPVLRERIVAFVRALIAAAQRLKREPELGWRLVAQAAELDIATVKSAWPHFNYPGTLATDLLDVFERQDVWIARTQGRAPRTRDALATLIDDNVMREATGV
jgi:NitT/TauT family transport system substrate-binding protein